MRGLLNFVVVFALSLSVSFVQAHDNTVVIPLGGAVGNATADDVIKGKTFSSQAGKGLTGNLLIRDGSMLYTNSIGMEFSLIPAGSFVMGSPEGTGDAAHRPLWPLELGRSSGEGGEDERQHVVILTEPFYLQTTEVTQGQWQQVIGTNPSEFDTCGLDCPVEMVSWYDAAYFANALSEAETPVFISCYDLTNCSGTPGTDFTCSSVSIVAGCTGYRLPTESQWEYAARAGTVTALYNGDLTSLSCSPVDPNIDEICWYTCNSGSTTHPVAQKIPNNWGLYDMAGNVWEWTADWYGAYPDGPVTDPNGPPTGSVKEIRGGSWRSPAFTVRAARRDNEVTPNYVLNGIGFRLALPVSQ